MGKRLEKNNSEKKIYIFLHKIAKKCMKKYSASVAISGNNVIPLHAQSN